MDARDVPDAISKALRIRPTRIPHRTSFDINPRIFADNTQLEQLDSPDWQIVYGRRGAGKTTLLATYAKYITDNASTEFASIELSVTDFYSLITNTKAARAPDLEKAQIYFADFIRLIANHLFKVFSEQNENSKFWRKYKDSTKKNYVQDLILQISESTRDSSAVSIGSRKKHNRKARREIAYGSDSSIGAKSNIGISASLVPALNAKANLDLQYKSSNSKKEQMEDESHITNYKFDYAATRMLIEELLELLSIKKLYLIIDEWAELDRSGRGRTQPYFAELLKRVFGNKPNFVIKIGSVRNQTKLSFTSQAVGVVGLEMSADIFELNLDKLYADQQFDKFRFFEDLLFRHLRFCNEDLSDLERQPVPTLYGISHSRPASIFLQTIFRSNDVLNLLISGAAALPRDFIDIFDRVAQKKNYQVVPAWHHRDVKTAVLEHCIQNKQSKVGRESHGQDLYESIIRAIKQNDSRLVAVQKDADRAKLITISDFYHSRLLHDIPEIDVPPILRNKYFFYYADLGLQLDVSREKLNDHMFFDSFPLNGSETEAEIRKYLI